jgi:hypothetical protein
VDYEHPDAFIAHIITLLGEEPGPMIIDGIRGREVLDRLAKNLTVPLSIISIIAPLEMRKRRYVHRARTYDLPYDVVAEFAIEVDQPVLPLCANTWIENDGTVEAFAKRVRETVRADGTTECPLFLERCVLCGDEGANMNNKHRPGVPLCTRCAIRHATLADCAVCKTFGDVYDRDPDGHPRCKSCATKNPDSLYCQHCQAPLRPPYTRSPKGAGCACPDCIDEIERTRNGEECSFCKSRARKICSHKDGLATCTKCYSNRHKQKGREMMKRRQSERPAQVLRLRIDHRTA